MEQKASRKSQWLTLFVVLLLGLLIIYWATTQRDSTSSIDEEEEENEHSSFVALAPSEALKHGVETASVSTEPLVITLTLPGKLILDQTKITHVTPQTSGIVRKIYVQVGDIVPEGAILATIESREVAEAKAAFIAAFKKEALMINKLEREKTLYNSRISASEDYFDAENRAAETMIELQLAKQKLEALGIGSEEIYQLVEENPPNLRELSIRAPAGGTIIQQHLHLGENLTAEQDIFTLADLGTLRAELSVFPKDLIRVKPSQTLTIIDAQGNSSDAILTLIHPLIEETTRSAKGIATVDNRDGKWLAGTFVTGKIIVDRIPVNLSVPLEAIQEIDGIPSVFVRSEEGFDIRPITLGRRDDMRIEVLQGLKPNETVAIGNTFLLKAEHEKHEAEHMD